MNHTIAVNLLLYYSAQYCMTKLICMYYVCLDKTSFVILDLIIDEIHIEYTHYSPLICLILNYDLLI